MCYEFSRLKTIFALSDLKLELPDEKFKILRDEILRDREKLEGLDDVEFKKRIKEYVAEFQAREGKS